MDGNNKNTISYGVIVDSLISYPNPLGPRVVRKDMKKGWILLGVFNGN